MQTDSGQAVGQKAYFDAIIIVPLEEEFSSILDLFEIEEEMHSNYHVRFSVKVPDSPCRFLLIKQHTMGKTSNLEAILESLGEFETGTLICVGIAGGVSSDIAIGDVCHTGTLIDVTDNMKVADTATRKRVITLSPMTYYSNREITLPISLDRISPNTKPDHLAWVNAQERMALSLIPGEFSGKEGKKEKILSPTVREGVIACGPVSGSPDYNQKIKATDRKVLAIETESGGMFSIAEKRRINALAVRGISDYAGIDKNKFEKETGGNARRIATLNAGSYLLRQLSCQRMRAYFAKTRARMTTNELQLQLIPPTPTDIITDTLLKLSEEFNSKLRELSPAFSRQGTGYRLPVPRIRPSSRTGIPTAVRETPIDVQDVLRESRVVTLHVPRQYPDLCLSWALASDLISMQLADKQCVPVVIDARSLQRPRTGIAQLADPNLLNMRDMPEVKLVFIIDEFKFESKTRVDFLKEQIDAWPDAQFLIVTRSQANVPLAREFSNKVAGLSALLNEISFLEMSNFLQKYFDLTPSESQAVAMRLRETFRKYSLSAHPSYFAGIPRTTLSALIQANRRAELIELAVAGYLSFVVAEDTQLVALSRKTREKFLTELAFEMKVNVKSFTEAELANYTEAFAKRFDFSISPTRFIASFIENGILHVESEKICFTLPFVESFLLAKRLAETPVEAIKYYSTASNAFDHSSFSLYAEIGAARGVVDRIVENIDECIAELHSKSGETPILLENKIFPAFLEHSPSIQSLQNRLWQAEEDVRNDRDHSRDKQRFLDATDRIREVTEDRASTSATDGANPAITAELHREFHALRVCVVAASLLGSGAERLEADIKRELVRKIVNLAAIVIDRLMDMALRPNYADIKAAIMENEEVMSHVSSLSFVKGEADAKRFAGLIVDMHELIALFTPFIAVVVTICDEARDNVLAESISHTEVEGGVETLIRNLWLSDIDVSRGKKALLQSIKTLPKAKFVRIMLAGHLISRVYWRHSRKEYMLDLLDVARQAIRGAGFNWDVSKMERGIKSLSEDEEIMC